MNKPTEVDHVREYLARMAEIHATGGATSETSYYGALENLLNAVGKTLNPRVICNGQIKNQGSGHPDFGLYCHTQCSSGKPKEGQSLTPERGVVEVKSLAEETWKTAETKQISKYWDRYGLVLVTNYRDFLIIGVDKAGKPIRLETFSLSGSDVEFWKACGKPQSTIKEKGGSFIEYLKRALAQLAPLSRPADLAWLLASYARDALARIEQHSDLAALAAIRSGLEEALGLKFEGSKGEHFFRSTLIQTLFYGVFSAWVQWCKDQPLKSTNRFDWHAAGWTLHVPMIKNLFEQIATPTRLGPLNLVEVLDWAGDALNRVNRAEFFAAFDQGQAVQYFYEPFLAAFDPDLRKQLGVWYTPPEIVKYMVARVDHVLQTELGIAGGLAASNVYVLDPCCGTGSFVVETLNVIAERLKQQGGDALVAHDLKQAAMNRVFGFEIMPAPFVIAHWQIGLRLADAGAPLGAGTERAAVYLTNALTGWEPPKGPKQHLMFPELEEERDAAEHVKREVPILVIIGNPPYNAFAGTSPEQEEGLVEPYKAGLQKEWGIRKFNLDDLYVRFFRIAERRIAEVSGRGLVSFISNYSWTERDSFVVMRRSLLSSFDRIWIENMHGNRVISEYSPDGRTSETVFAVAGYSPGIQQGITIGLLARVSGNGPCVVSYRDDFDQAKADDRRAALLATLADTDFESHYALASPTAENFYAFRPWNTAASYSSWPSLVDLASQEPFSGLSEKRRGALINHDRDALAERMRSYLDPKLSFAKVRDMNSGPVIAAGRFEPEAARKRLLANEPFDEARLRRYAMYPFDQRWSYHTDVRPIWNEPRPALAAVTGNGNLIIVSRMGARRPDEGLPITATTALPNHHLLDPNAHAIPARILTGEDVGGLFSTGPRMCANLSERARNWLKSIEWPDPDLSTDAGNAPWLHALAIGCSPAWLTEHKPAILAGWPRVPLPASAAALSSSAALGARLAKLLDPDQSVKGVTIGNLESPFRVLGAMTSVNAKAIKPDELAITAGWGHGGAGKPVMPSRGRVTERTTYSSEEMAEIAAAAKKSSANLADVLKRLGPPVDVWLNDVAYWRAVPKAVWEFSLGGYQVIKKWLSYRDATVLGRPLSTEEAREVSSIVRRLAAIILMTDELNANYAATRDNSFPWPSAA